MALHKFEIEIDGLTRGHAQAKLNILMEVLGFPNHINTDKLIGSTLSHCAYSFLEMKQNRSNQKSESQKKWEARKQAEKQSEVAENETVLKQNSSFSFKGLLKSQLKPKT